MSACVEVRWMRLKQAALYSSIGVKRLVELAQEGKIKGVQDPENKRGDWIFDRVSLDEYREGHFSGRRDLRQKALEILKGVRP